MIIKKLKSLSQTGDTIVEVVIAITVLGIVLGTAAVTANHNANSLQDTQEHTVALKLAQAQLEYFREYIQDEDHMADIEKASSNIYPGKKFCLYAASESSEILVRPANHGNCRINSGGAPVLATDSDIAYNVSVELKSETGKGYIAYANVGWEGLRTASPNVGLSYRFHDTLGASIGGSAGGACPAGYQDMGPPLGCVRTCGFYGMVPLDGTDGMPAPIECGIAPTVTLHHQELSASSSRFTWSTTGDFNRTQCKYDSGPWTDCNQPRTVTYATPGASGQTHTFQVRVFGMAGPAEAGMNWTWTPSQEWVPPVTHQEGRWDIWWNDYVCWNYGPNGSCYNQWGYPHGHWVCRHHTTGCYYTVTIVDAPGYYRDTSRWVFN